MIAIDKTSPERDPRHVDSKTTGLLNLVDIQRKWEAEPHHGFDTLTRRHQKRVKDVLETPYILPNAKTNKLIIFDPLTCTHWTISAQVKRIFADDLNLAGYTSTGRLIVEYGKTIFGLNNDDPEITIASPQIIHQTITNAFLATHASLPSLQSALATTIQDYRSDILKLDQAIQRRADGSPRASSQNAQIERMIGRIKQLESRLSKLHIRKRFLPFIPGLDLKFFLTPKEMLPRRINKPQAELSSPCKIQALTLEEMNL